MKSEKHSPPPRASRSSNEDASQQGVSSAETNQMHHNHHPQDTIQAFACAISDLVKSSTHKRRYWGPTETMILIVIRMKTTALNRWQHRKDIGKDILRYSIGTTLPIRSKEREERTNIATAKISKSNSCASAKRSLSYGATKKYNARMWSTMRICWITWRITEP